MDDEFHTRCNDAQTVLYKLAVKYLDAKNELEYKRLMGKIEGIKLAQSYAAQSEQPEWTTHMSIEDIAAELSGTFDLGLPVCRDIAKWIKT